MNASVQRSNVNKQEFNDYSAGIKKLFTSYVNYFESPQYTLQAAVLTFLCVLVVRNFLEVFSQRGVAVVDPGWQIFLTVLVHYNMSFLAIILAISLILHAVTKESIANILKIMLPSAVILWLAPMIDLLSTKGVGANLAYLSPIENLSLVRAYFTYFGAYVGATFGIKVEVALVLLLVGSYSYFKTSKLLFSIGAVWISYTAIFIWGATPFVIKLLVNSMGIEYTFSAQYLLNYFLIVDLFLLVITSYFLSPVLFRAILVEIPVSRVIYYELMLLLGVSLAIYQPYQGYPIFLSSRLDLILHACLFAASLFLALLFSMITNNIYDTEIDRISNSTRALVSGAVALEDYRVMGFCMLALSLFIAAFVGPYCFLIILVIISAYYLYSAPPLRLKRIPMLSKLVISGNSVALLIAGYWMVHESMEGFPAVFALTFLVGATVVANLIDLKDVEGDSVAKIKTLPILIGRTNAKVVLSASILIMCIVLGMSFDNWALQVLLFVFGALLAAMFFTRKFRDAYVINGINAGVFILALLLLMN